MRSITKIIIHHSDSDFGDMAQIDQWHKERGFGSPSGIHCGYHKIILNGVRKFKQKYYIDEDGMIEDGRPLEEKGAHTTGHNGDSIGICLIARDKFTHKQMDVLAELIRKFKKEFPSIVEVAGHNKYENTTCPMFNWTMFLEERGL